VVRGEVPDHAVVAGAPAKVVRRWTPANGWQPPLRTPAPVPIPDGVTPEQLVALSDLDDETVARLAELDEDENGVAVEVQEGTGTRARSLGPAAPGAGEPAARLAALDGDG
jgi:hypothetical protein